MSTDDTNKPDNQDIGIFVPSALMAMRRLSSIRRAGLCFILFPFCMTVTVMQNLGFIDHFSGYNPGGARSLPDRVWRNKWRTRDLSQS